MKSPNQEYEDISSKSKDQGTGSHNDLTDYKLVVYPFDKYQITVKLSTGNKFLEITEVRINKKFISFKNKQPKSYHDVDDLYRE